MDAMSQQTATTAMVHLPIDVLKWDLLLPISNWFLADAIPKSLNMTVFKCSDGGS